MEKIEDMAHKVEAKRLSVQLAKRFKEVCFNMLV